MSPGFNKLVAFARAVHTYLTLFALPALCFLAVTGVMLNHGEWLDRGDPQVRTTKGKLPIEIVRQANERAIVEALRNRLGARGAVHDFATENEQVQVVFLRPGERTEAAIQRSSGAVELVTEFHGTAGVVTDLHRGKEAGRGWKWLIDLTGGVLLLSIITGFIIWLPLPKRRWGGILALLLGAATGAAAYFFLIPS